MMFPWTPELDDATVGVARTAHAPSYPTVAPFHPDSPFPELAALYGDNVPTASEANDAYRAVRDAFENLGLDPVRCGSSTWNPLSEVVRPGDLVVIKPNWVKESHLLVPGAWEEVVTHGSVLRPIIDYVLIALGGRGRLVIADGPQTDSSFDTIVEVTQMKEVVEWARSVAGDVGVELLDLRQEEHRTEDGVIVSRRVLGGDPAGYVEYDLGRDSEFVGHRGRYFGASFDVAETNRAHTDTVHRYRISRTVAQADVVINVPKLKTHKKCGITCSLKNMVGVNGWKNFLPHHSEGTPRMGGDQFPENSFKATLEYHLMGRFKQWVLRCPDWLAAWLRHLKKPGRAAFGDTEEVVRSGNWHGNDTIWRMVLDLNKLLFYGDTEGRLGKSGVRRYLSVVDGIVGGEGNGPMCPDPVSSGIVLAGRNPVAVDMSAAVLAGLDPRKMPSVVNGTRCRSLPLARFGIDDVNVSFGRGEVLPLGRVSPWFRFRPHFGWENHVELEGPMDSEGVDHPRTSNQTNVAMEPRNKAESR